MSPTETKKAWNINSMSDYSAAFRNAWNRFMAEKSLESETDIALLIEALESEFAEE